MKHILEQEHYTENFVQCILSAMSGSLTGSTLVVGGDGRYFGKKAVDIIIKMCAANGVRFPSVFCKVSIFFVLSNSLNCSVIQYHVWSLKNFILGRGHRLHFSCAMSEIVWLCFTKHVSSKLPPFWRCASCWWVRMASSQPRVCLASSASTKQLEALSSLQATTLEDLMLTLA